MSFINNLFSGTGGGILAGVLALIIVIALIILLVWALKFLTDMTASVGRRQQKRLGVVESIAIDQKRQLILIRRDNVEHLIMIGGVNEFVVESSILHKSASSDNKNPITKNPPKDTPKSNDNPINKNKKDEPTVFLDDIKETKPSKISLRQTGLLRRTGDTSSKINPQTSAKKS
jgi:flagellar biogenesis protein FliO